MPTVGGRRGEGGLFCGFGIWLPLILPEATSCSNGSLSTESSGFPTCLIVEVKGQTATQTAQPERNTPGLWRWGCRLMVGGTAGLGRVRRSQDQEESFKPPSDQPLLLHPFLRQEARISPATSEKHAFHQANRCRCLNRVVSLPRNHKNKTQNLKGP